MSPTPVGAGFDGNSRVRGTEFPCVLATLAVRASLLWATRQKQEQQQPYHKPFHVFTSDKLNGYQFSALAGIGISPGAAALAVCPRLSECRIQLCIKYNIVYDVKSSVIVLN